MWALLFHAIEPCKRDEESRGATYVGDDAPDSDCDRLRVPAPLLTSCCATCFVATSKDVDGVDAGGMLLSLTLLPPLVPAPPALADAPVAAPPAGPAGIFYYPSAVGVARGWCDGEQAGERSSGVTRTKLVHGSPPRTKQ